MVRQWQELFWDKRYNHVEIGQWPDFVKLAEAYDAPGMQLEDRNTLACDMNIDTLAIGPIDDERTSRITTRTRRSTASCGHSA